MSDHPTTRVRYTEGQFLGAQEFSDEQQYHLAQRRRHNIAHHTWGIVYGLGLTKDTDLKLWVEPGVAIDGYGRELVVPQRLQLQDFDSHDGDELGVWLLYERASVEGEEAGDGGGRWRESARVRLDRINWEHPDMREPLGLPEGDEEFGPTRVAPDSPTRTWQVYLGKITRTREAGKQEFSIDLSGRPYAGLVGAAIDTPAGDVRLQIGPDTARSRRRFAVVQRGSGATPDAAFLAIDDAGALQISGDATVDGSLHLARGGALEFGAGGAQPVAPPRLPQQSAWRMYYHPKSVKDQGTVQELRIEMAPRGEGPSQVVIGAWSEETKEFKALLTVSNTAEPAVTVHGDLVVGGVLHETVPRAAPQLSQAAQAALLPTLLGAMNRTLAGTATQGESDVTALERILGDDQGLDAAIGALDRLQRWPPFIARQVQVPAGRGGAVAALLSSYRSELARGAADLAAPERVDLFVELLQQPPAVTALVAVLAADERLLQTILEHLARSEEGRSALRRVFTTLSGPLRGVFLSIFLSVPELREQLAAKLYEEEELLRELLSWLLQGEKRQEKVIRLLLDDDARRKALIARLLSEQQLPHLVAWLVDDRHDTMLRRLLGQLLADKQDDKLLGELLKQQPGSK